MVLDDSGPRRTSSLVADMPNLTAAASAAAAVSTTSAAPVADDSACTITVNTKGPANFPPPKTDKPRPHVCGTCQRSFARLEHLKRHERSHTKEKPFECVQCTRCFARRDLLLRHQQKLHQSSAPSSRSRNRRESASGATPAQNRRKSSIAGVGNAGPNSAAAPMRPRANTISHVDGVAMQMLAASAGATPARGAAHNRHPSLIGIPFHGMDHVFGGMSAALGQRGFQHVSPKLDTSQMLSGDFDNIAGLRTAPPMALFNPDFDPESIFFAPGSTINPNALHYNDSPQSSMVLDPMSPTGPTSGYFDDNLDWVSGFDHHLSLNTNDNVIDGSSPSAISTTSQSGISDVMVDGSNHPDPAGTSALWQPLVMGGPPMPNSFAMELSGSVFPDLLSDAPSSPQPAAQKINDPYFSADAPSLSLLSTAVVSGMQTPSLNTSATHGCNADSRTPLVCKSRDPEQDAASPPVTTITDATRTAIVNLYSHCLRRGNCNVPVFSSPGPTRSLQEEVLSGGDHNSPTFPLSSAITDLPAPQDLRKYVARYLTCFHAHLPFLHIPTMSFGATLTATGNDEGLAGMGCLLLSMASLGAACESDHNQSRLMSEMAKTLVEFQLDEGRGSDEIKSESRWCSREFGPDPQHERASISDTPLRLLQATLLNVMYDYIRSDEAADDVALTNYTALLNLSRSAIRFMKHGRAHVATAQPDAQMTDEPARSLLSEQEQRRMQEEWLEWKTMEEHKRTVYATFIMSSIAAASRSHRSVLTNSEMKLDLPCDEELFEAESSTAFAAKGGLKAANHNRLTFFNAFTELLNTNERQRKLAATVGNNHDHEHLFGSLGMHSPTTSLTNLRPSTFGCLVLIYSLHNYIWETKQVRKGKVRTPMETEKTHVHIEAMLKAWRQAWLNNVSYMAERSIPSGAGPMSTDAIPLLELAHVKLFVKNGSVKGQLSPQWDNTADGEAKIQARPPEHIPDAGAYQMSDSVIMGGNNESAGAQHLSSAVSVAREEPLSFSRDLHDGVEDTTRREEQLRAASCHALNALTASDGPEVASVGDQWPLSSALCTAECAHVVAEWLTALQKHVGACMGVIGQDTEDFTRIPAIIMLEEEDVKLLERIKDTLAAAEKKISMRSDGDALPTESVLAPDGFNGYAAKILRYAAWMLKNKFSTTWQAVNVAVQNLESRASRVRVEAEESTVDYIAMTM